MHYTRNTLLMILLSALTGQLCHAQWNTIAGYELMRPGLDQFNHLLNTINDGQENPEELAAEIKYLHGIMVGLRYNHSLGAVELAYRTGLTRRRGKAYSVQYGEMDIEDSNGMVIGTMPLNAEIQNLDFLYRLSAFSLNLEFGRTVTFGGSLDYNTTAQRVKYSSNSVGLRTFKDTQHSWGNRVFIGAHLANTQHISFSVRLFYQWHWTAGSLTPLRDRFFLPEDVCSTCLEQPKFFGLSIIINNGNQR